MDKTVQFELTREFLDRIEQAIEAENKKFISESLDGINPADIAAILSEFTSEQCKYVFDLLDSETDAEILMELEEDTRKDFMILFNSDRLAQFFDTLESDDGADVLMQLPLRTREEVIGYMADDEKAGNVVDLLRYDEDVAGGLMGKEFVRANKNWTVGQCIDELRRQAEKVEKVFFVFVVDDQEKLEGTVSLKDLILTNDDIKVSEICETEIHAVEPYQDEREVVAMMQKYDLEAVAVINARNKLVGRITIDDVVDVMAELAEEERQLMAGISSDVEEDDSVWALSKARLPWLIIGMVGGLMAAELTSFFSEDITVIAGLALFIPLIMATGGNVGIQSSSLIVQSLANKNAFEDPIGNRLLKMLMVAVVNGVILSVITFGAVVMIFKDQSLSLTVSIALFSVVLLASFMGTVTPLVLDKLGINPALASGPFITTANDLIGLAVYFLIATFLYNL